MQLITASRQLAKACDLLSFSGATHVYNPLIYARESYEIYLRRYAASPKKAIFLGINPGPWGMAQTGIPFGDVKSVSDYLNISATVKTPPNTHPKRPIYGLNCPRSEVSGSRLWALFHQQFGTAEQFFKHYLVLNYCPLLFLRAIEKQVSNLTPDKLAATETAPLYNLCDDFIHTVEKTLRPAVWVGVGGFAEARLNFLFGDSPARIGKILHPSPASPAANRSFFSTAAKQLGDLGL